MLKHFFLVLLLALCRPAVHLQAQINTDGAGLFKKYAGESNSAADVYYIVQLLAKCGLPGGLQIVRTIADDILIVKGAGEHPPLKVGNCISKIAPANNQWKLSPLLEAGLINASNEKQLHLFSVTVSDINIFLSSNHFAGRHCRAVYVDKASGSAVIECSKTYLRQTLLPDSSVVFADAYQLPHPEIYLNGFDRSRNSINQSGFSFPFADGTGVVTGIKERSMDVNDVDLRQRIVPSPIAASDVEQHATSIATMIGGAGNSFYTGRGIARKCSFFSSSFLNLFPDSTNLLIQNKINIQNHSYGTINQQFYGAEAAAYDVQTWQNKNLLHVFSSGNRGTEAAATGTYSNITGFANLTGNFKMAKNIVTVGAIDTSGNIAQFSSSGPLYDGRMAPQVTAFGLNGTSDAAALISGTATLLHQVYKDSNAQAVPPASLVRAVLFNTTDDIGAKGIDYRSGFGAINVYGAVAAMLQKKYEGNQVQQAQVWTKNIIVPAQAANLTITLVWTDTASLVNNSKALVNDLDLELVETTTGTVYKPWCLSTFPNADSLKKLPIRRRDSLNTAEQVSVDLPAAGQWQLRVTGRVVQTVAAQPFYVSWRWDTLNTFLFTNPKYAEDVSIEEKQLLSIKWKTAPADTSTTGNLSISYNAGTTWQPLAQGIKLVSRQYKWAIKDTASTAILKMDCAFGSFLSGEFIISPLTSITVDFLCPDSTGLSWKKHVYATGYRIYALAADTAYLKPVAVTTDTSITLKRNLYNYTVYAIEPLLSNSGLAARSPALDITTQAVNCFYISLIGLNNGDKIDLTLELSTLKNVDSVIFEKVRSDNTLLRIEGRQQVIAGRLGYAVTDASPSTGINFYRGRIVNKNRQSSYTETIAVITTGKQYIFIYPNPLPSGRLLNYQLKDIPADWQLQLIDVQGRIVLNQPVAIAGTLKTSLLQAGLYFFRLTDKKTGMSETGKIVIAN
jgi:hypothetical protein